LALLSGSFGGTSHNQAADGRLNHGQATLDAKAALHRLGRRDTAATPVGRITKMGDRTIRRLLVIGAMATIRWSRSKEGFEESWLGRLIAKKPIKLAAVALANKTARIIWAVMTRKETFRTA
jgi:transposase